MFWFYANHYWKFKQKNIAHRECIFGNHLLTCIRSMLALVISSDHKSYRSTNTARKKGTQSWLRLCGPQYYDKNVEIYLVKVNKTYLHANQISTSATRIAWLSAESVFVFVLFLLKKDNTRKYMGLKIANKQNLRKYKNVRVNRFSKTNLRSVATSRKKRCEQKKTARDMIEKAVLLNFYMQVTNHRTNGRV